jgi:hypothetical protein
MRKGFLVETLIVGASVAAVGAGLKGLYKVAGWDKDATPSEPAQQVPWPVWLFVTGALAHVAWESSGGNKYFCETRWPESTAITNA